MDKSIKENREINVCRNESIGTLIRDERIRQDVGLAQLCGGLMSEGNLCRIESGKRETDASTIKRLTDRLGMVYEEQGTYIFYDDYEEWKKRWEIIDAIETKNMGQAASLIEQYISLYSENNVRMQFAKIMEIQCQIENPMGSDAIKNEDICSLYRKALKLTMPINAGSSLKNLYLSINELNIVLEYRFHNCRKSVRSLEEILKYLDNSRFSLSAKALLYPKTVVYMYRKMISEGKMDETLHGNDGKLIARMYEYCENALAMLRQKTVRYYYTEILEIRKAFLGAGHGGDDSGNLLIKTDEWLGAIHDMCNKYDVWEYTTNNCYFYKENSVYNIGTVVSTRRKMLGITMQELYEGICSEKTLRNLEHNRASTHRDIAEELLGRLGLPAGYHRMGIITDKRETVELYTKWKRLSRQFNYAECMEVMNELEEQLSPHIVNRQFVEWGKNITAYGLKKLDYVTYIERMCDCIGITVKIDNILSAENVYLSNNEKSILYQISAKYKFNGDENNAFKHIRPIYKGLIDLDEIQTQENIKDYEFYMTFIASILGSMGRYEQSNMISDKVIKAQLRYGRIGEIHCNLFNTAWNGNEKEHNKKAYNDSLYLCILWSQMCNDTYFENLYSLLIN